MPDVQPGPSPILPRRRLGRPLPRGACPSLDRPLGTGDGLLARLRPIDGALTLDGLRAVAEAARVHGNGRIEITARGSLQLRGLSPESAAPLAAAITVALKVENGLVVETPPLAGLDPFERADPRPLAAALRRAIAAEGLALRLNPKVGVVVDGMGRLDLSALATDIRVEAIADGWRVLAGGRFYGRMSGPGVVPAVLALLDAIARLGPEARGRDLPLAAPVPRTAPAATPRPPAVIGTHPLRDGGQALGLGLAFGAIEAGALMALANAAGAVGAMGIRLAPTGALLVIGLAERAVASLRHEAALLGLVADAGDPRLSLRACPGSAGCAAGSRATRPLAARLALKAPGLLDGSFTLHVAGCAKGCAHPRPALLTLVGDAAGWALVVEGRAGDAAVPGLDAAAIEAGFARLGVLHAARPLPREDTASWLRRLGAERIIAAFAPDR